MCIRDRSMRVEGESGLLQADLIHSAYASLHEYKMTMDYYSTLSACRAFQEGKGKTRLNRWANILFRPPLTYINHLLVRRSCLHGLLGFRLASGQASYAFRKYLMLDTLRRTYGDILPDSALQNMLRSGKA